MGGHNGERQHAFAQPSDPAAAGHEILGQADPELRVGKSLARLRQDLLDTGKLLCEVLEPGGTGLVTDAMRVLQQQTCRIAVVGQIKAGKSSFINALVQQPDLLPTDVNPWTTVVTNLHLRGKRDGEDAAVFQFFTASEWDKLADGGGKLRELTERLVPGFETELLRRHVLALRTRAETRLGPEFARLLGQSHRFTELTPDVLQQYVCQGDMAGLVVANQPVGRFSDITKTADLVLPSGPFDYPVAVIDTPGTNDPFLVRDEITRGCLESADIYIVVLTARQALAASDVALLRILRGLEKERIIVFLNRIDELTDIAKDCEQVIDQVRRKLRLEFPGADIPLIEGSAWWANCALARDFPGERALRGRAVNYLQNRGLLLREHVVRPAEGGDQHAGMRSALFSASGLKRVYVALDELIRTSHYAYLLRQMSACFAEMSRASENAARQELGSLGQGGSTDRRQAELKRLRGELEQLQRVSEIIDRSATRFQDRQMSIVTVELNGLRRRLMQLVDQCAMAERDLLVLELQAKGRKLRAWRFDPQKIRRTLAEEFVAGFRAAEAQLLGLQQEVVPHLSGLMAILVPNGGDVIPANMVHRPVPPPRLASLGSYVALDLADSWWSLLWKARPAPLQRGREVERLIKSEFRAVVERLIHACEDSLSDHVVRTTEWSFGMCDSIARSIAQRREHLVEYYEKLQHEVDDGATERNVDEERVYMTAVSGRLETCTSLRKQLERIESEIARDLPAAG
jgi:GTP-binding protein EngB required for normal cell division